MTKWPRFHAAAAVVLALSLVALATSARQPRPLPSLRAAYADAGPLRIRYARGGSGPAVLLLHGYGESLVAWRGVFGRLAEGADVIAIDLPGFGLSAKPASGYATDSLALAVIRFLDAVGIQRVSIVAHSLGGAVAAAVALHAPSRVGRLVLLDAALVGAPGALPGSEGGARARASRSAITEYEAMRSRFTAPHDPHWLAEADSEAAYVPAGDPAYRAALSATLEEFDFGWLTAERAARLSLPTLILWGEYDPVFPLASGRALAAALPGARFEVVPRTWHRPHVERPHAVAELIVAFLEAGSAGPIRSNP